MTVQATSLVQEMHPLSWWVGLHHTQLQIMLHGEDIAEAEISFKGEALPIIKRETTTNPNYIFLYVETKDAKAQTYYIKVRKGCKKQILPFTLNSRKENSAQRASFGPQDAVYLIMPDRFSNGNPSNDQIKGYAQGVELGALDQRQGGDLQGIINHVDYLKGLGVTALWLTPVLEDKDTIYSYHHYAISNYYKVDPRFGCNEDYKRLADTLHQNQLKLIMDVVPNHCGITHTWTQDRPSKDWYNQWETFTRTNYKVEVSTDPHASVYDKKQLQKGWFDTNMPDLNLGNPLLFDYLRQSYIYWIEWAGVDGLRCDTYPYNEKNDVARLFKALRTEYPHLTIVGECWVKSVAQTAYFQTGQHNHDGFDSQLPSVMDFMLRDYFATALTEKEDWNTGLMKFYDHYTQDFAYPNPQLVMNMADNHDMNRMSAELKDNLNLNKMVTAILLTLRGYPQIYYGDEIFLKGKVGRYEDNRACFPGGWAKDTHNAFTKEGRSQEEQAMYLQYSRLLNFRKVTPALQTGKMIQFIPKDGIYVYFRKDKQDTIMVVVNKNTTEQTLDLKRFEEMSVMNRQAYEVCTEQTLNLTNTLTVPSQTTLVLTLK